MHSFVIKTANCLIVHSAKLPHLPDPANYHDSEVPEEAKTLAHVSEQNFTTIFGMEMLRGLNHDLLCSFFAADYL